MSSFTEFVIVALVLFVWESVLWFPLRCVALRRQWFGKRWKVLDPRRIFATREVGVVPLMPLPPDAGLAPCQSPPLLVDEQGAFLVESADGHYRLIDDLTWDGVRHDHHHLVAAGVRIRISSPRCIDVLRRAKRRGATPQDAVKLAWRMALSPGNAGRELRRWKLVSGPLGWHGLLLVLGFFIGLPLVYMYCGSFPAVWFALWLWLLMGFTAGQLWWLGQRVYPGVRSALRMDALLALLVPFHAMRAYEIASAHAMGTIHPFGLILSSGDLDNPWLGGMIRRFLHPLPETPNDAKACGAMMPMLARVLAGLGKAPGDFDHAPDASNDEAAALYCPRCHGLYRQDVARCSDCRGLALRPLR